MKPYWGMKALLIAVINLGVHVLLRTAEQSYRNGKIASYEAACTSGNDSICLKLVSMYFQGREGKSEFLMAVDSSPYKVLEYLAESCGLGNADSCMRAVGLLETRSSLSDPEPFRAETYRLGKQDASEAGSNPKSPA